MPVNKTVSVSSFQQCDGSNFTTAGVEVGQNINPAKFSIYAGVGTSFKDNSTGAVFDFKGSVPYSSNSIMSASFRLRNNINPNSQSLQIRVQPFNASVPIGKGTSVYADPYVAAKIDYKNGYDNTKVGVFAGVSQNLDKNTKVFVEGQLYDVTKVNSSTTSVNAGVSISF
jgi:hypothetical protein